MSEILTLAGVGRFPDRRIVWPGQQDRGHLQAHERGGSAPADECAAFFESRRLSARRFSSPRAHCRSTPTTRAGSASSTEPVFRTSERTASGIGGHRHRQFRAAKVGMALTARKTVTQLMRYVHTEDDPAATPPIWWPPDAKAQRMVELRRARPTPPYGGIEVPVAVTGRCIESAGGSLSPCFRC